MNALSHFYDHYGVAAPDDPILKSAFRNPQQHAPLSECAHLTTRGNFNRRFRGDPRNDFRIQPDGDECRDWLKTQLGPIPLDDVSKDAGCTKRAAENIRAGENGIQMKFLVALCRNNPIFRADFFRFCGGYLESDPEFVAGITMALNSLSRRQI